MTDYATLQSHATAVMDLLYADPDLTVYPAADGGPSTVPIGTRPPYVSVHIVSDRPSGGRLDARSTSMRVRIFCHCVGANDIAARAVVDRVSALLLDVRPTIAGRSVYPIRHEQTRDADVTEPVAQTTVTITDVYRLETET